MPKSSALPKNAKIYLDKPYVQLFWNPSIEAVICRWTGFCTYEEITGVALRVMDVVLFERAKKVLYDATDMEVLEEESQLFISGAFTRQMIEAGVEYSATVFPKDIFAKFSVDDIRKSMPTLKKSRNLTFDSTQSALAWLKKQV